MVKMMMYAAVLKDAIEKEKAYKDFIYNEADKNIAQGMLREINALGYNFRYIAEIDAFRVPNSGDIIAKHINDFTSEATRAYLIEQMVYDKIADCDSIILKLYLHFKASTAYISKANCSAPVHIHVRYDNAFRKLKPKRLKSELMEIVSNPRDACYLPFTTRMMSSWKIPELKEVLISYLDGTSVTAESVDLNDKHGTFYPSLATIKRELKFTAIAGLKYYPSTDIIELIEKYAFDSDRDISVAAQKTLKRLQKRKE